MSNIVTEIRSHAEAVLIVIVQDSLDPAASKQVADNVHAAALRKRGVPVVLDMSRVAFAPSCALGMLVQLNRTFKLSGRRFVLIGVKPQVLGPMKATNLHTIVEIHDTLDDAIHTMAVSH